MSCKGHFFDDTALLFSTVPNGTLFKKTSCFIKKLTLFAIKPGLQTSSKAMGLAILGFYKQAIESVDYIEAKRRPSFRQERRRQRALAILTKSPAQTSSLMTRIKLAVDGENNPISAYNQGGMNEQRV
ncbi:MAG: hypothetical protein H6573_23265 [Lewinellaceae bacterium]|nr:hypothetical protein [Lewinellaceae bacterium]